MQTESKVVTIDDVRKELWKAYKKAELMGINEGKSSDGYVAVKYPNIWDCETEEQFSEPYAIEVYSYLLGPSRMHNFIKGKGRNSYHTWYCEDIFAKAVDVIKSWADGLNNYYNDEQDGME